MPLGAAAGQLKSEGAKGEITRYETAMEWPKRTALQSAQRINTIAADEEILRCVIQGQAVPSRDKVSEKTEPNTTKRQAVDGAKER